MKDRKNKKQIIFIIFLLLFVIVFLYYWTKPKFIFPGTVKIFDQNGILLYQLSSSLGKKINVKYEDFPPHLINAVISIEDQSFWENPGFDLKAIIRSLLVNLRSGKIVSGASTITQQLARLSFSDKKNRSFFRKIKEILIAIRINFLFSKKEILTTYLNNVYFGNMVYGAQSASLLYFNKDVNNLSLNESAFLAGLIASPERYNPYLRIDQAKKRRNEVLDLMVKKGYLSSKKSKKIKEEEINVEKNVEEIKAPHFVFYVLSQLEKKGFEKNKDLNVYTTLNYYAYQAAHEISSDIVLSLMEKHNLTNASLVLIRNETGEIIVMMGGVNFFDKKNQGQVNMTTSLRQPGSTLKPIVYAVAFTQGYTPASLIFDVKKTYLTKKGEGYTPYNYDGKYHGLVLVREALASSYNLPAVEMLSKIGIKDFLQTAREMGLKSLRDDRHYDLSIALGGCEATLIELTNTYATFARGGYYKDFYTISKIYDDKGRVIYRHKNGKPKQTLGKNGEMVSYLITDILSDPKARMPGFGEKNLLVLNRPVAVKTGTTTDWHDNWTIGYTPSYTLGVWVGNNNNQPMKKISGIFGAAPIWNQFFEKFLKDKPFENFKIPNGIKKIEICATSGLLPDQLCLERYQEVFIEGTEPKEKSTIHKKVLIDKRNGLKAGKGCSEEFTEERIFIDYPPEVFRWAKENSLPIIPDNFSPFCLGQDDKLKKSSYIEIIYPGNKAIFETAPLMVRNEKIVFEVNVSSDIKKVFWFLNNQLISENDNFPFSFSWLPKKGEHFVFALGVNDRGEKIKTQLVKFSVVEFKEND